MASPFFECRCLRELFGEPAIFVHGGRQPTALRGVFKAYEARSKFVVGPQVVSSGASEGPTLDILCYPLNHGEKIDAALQRAICTRDSCLGDQSPRDQD